MSVFRVQTYGIIKAINVKDFKYLQNKKKKKTTF